MPVDRSTFVVGQGSPIGFANDTADHLDLWEGADPSDYVETSQIVASGITDGKIWRGPTDPAGSASNGDVWIDTFCFETTFDGGAWPAVTQVDANVTANTYTFSLQQKTDPNRSRNIASKVGRIANASGSNGSDRRVYTFDAVPDLLDVDVVALLWGRTSPQQGLACRVCNIGNATTQNMYVCWNDATFELPDWWNIAAWKGVPSDTSGGIGGLTDSLQKKYQVYGGDITSNVATMNVGEGHDIRVGDKFEADTSIGSPYNPSGDTVTAVTPTTVSWSKTAGNRSDPTMTGWAGTWRTVFPHWVRMRVVGAKVGLKVWRYPDAEPAWSDPSASFFWTDAVPKGPTATAGKVGILNAHQEAAEWSEWAYVRVTRADPGVKLRVAGAWVPFLPSRIRNL